MGWAVMIYTYIPSSIWICSGIQNLVEGGFTDTQTACRSHKSISGKWAKNVWNKAWSHIVLFFYVNRLAFSGNALFYSPSTGLHSHPLNLSPHPECNRPSLITSHANWGLSENNGQWRHWTDKCERITPKHFHTSSWKAAQTGLFWGEEVNWRHLNTCRIMTRHCLPRSYLRHSELPTQLCVLHSAPRSRWGCSYNKARR